MDCHPGTKVGEYVPFYFCPRSIMLFLLYKGNHPDLTYTREASARLCISGRIYEKVVESAESEGRRWAFSNGNAGTRYALHSSMTSGNWTSWTGMRSPRRTGKT